MSKRSEKMYKDSPKLKRDDEDGKVKVGKSDKESEEANAGTDGIQEHEGIPSHVRHAIERREVHHRHENEHMLHDHGKMDKPEMHKRHQDEVKAMHKRHEKEGGKKETESKDKTDTGEKQIEKVESTGEEE